jgi:hypothetical protein
MNLSFFLSSLISVFYYLLGRINGFPVSHEKIFLDNFSIIIIT